MEEKLIEKKDLFKIEFGFDSAKLIGELSNEGINSPTIIEKDAFGIRLYFKEQPSKSKVEKIKNAVKKFDEKLKMR